MSMASPARRAAFISFQDQKVRRLNLDTFEFEQEIATLSEPDSSYAWIQTGNASR